MAAIPSSGSLLATYDYYGRRLDSTFSNSSCGSIECPGEAIPHPPGLPKADPGHWWASLFFGKSTLPFMATVLESAEHPEPPTPDPPGLQQHDHRCSGSGRPESSTASAGPRS
uniref:Pancreatic progenitor cell differentiation and proliferation factor n=1 Tax=Theropithecus gelada TaxID=9565 RepID=A0A8D2K4F7_THEGE